MARYALTAAAALAACSRAMAQDDEASAALRLCTPPEDFMACAALAPLIASRSAAAAAEAGTEDPLAAGVACVNSTECAEPQGALYQGMADVAFDVDAGHLYDMSKAFAEKGESSLTLVAEELDDTGVPGYYPIALVTTAWCDAQPAAPTLTDLENVTACSTGYQKTAGWKASVGTLIAEGIIPPVIDGNSEVPNDLLSAEAFFGEGCVPGAIDFFKDGHEEEGHDDHGHGASCACVAEAANWTLDCSSVAPVSAAMAYLQANCNETMVADMIEGEPDEEACHQNYMLMQAHHDFCPHSSLPPAFEAAMHDFEELFEDCHIDRQFDPALAVCTAIENCTDSAALLESIDALQASCTEDCSSDECVKAFQTVLMAHDTCDEDLLPITLEKALHDFEEVCEDSLCNSISEPFQPVCEEEEDEHSEEEEGHDDHGHGASCACVAEAANWTLDCSSVAPVSAAMAYLQANCNETMVADMIEGEPDEEACHQNYMLMQAHHDFCPHSSLPPAFEAAMHDFEELFEDCHIDRQFDPALAVCTAIENCTDSAALLESIDALQASCTEDCSSDECVKAFQTVLMAHDTCDEDLLPITLEKALHDFEEVCEDSLCNSISEPFQPVCEEEEDEHSEEEHVALCEACAGQGDAFCEKVDGEPYYDYDGALRCLAEGAGGVAFVKHSTAETFLSNPDPSWTFADPPTADLDDYRILCYTPGNPSAGGCVPVDQYAGCSFPQALPHTVVARDETPAVAAFEQALAYLSANDAVFQETFLEGGTMAGTLFSDDIAVIAGVEESVDEYAGSMFSSWQALDDLNAGLSQKSGGE